MQVLNHSYKYYFNNHIITPVLYVCSHLEFFCRIGLKLVFTAGGGIMNRLQMNNFLAIEGSKSLEKSQREAKQYLNKITLLQGKLNIEEQNLRVLLKIHGSKILN